jgi:hypothetical protein
MLPRLQLAALFALCFCPLACVSGSAPPAATVAAWQLSVSIEGGFAGIEQRFNATSASDALIVVDAVRGTETAVPLGSTEKLELAQAVAARATAPDIDLRSTTCRDCFLFEMTMSSGRAGKPRSVRYDSQMMDASPDAKLIERVIAIGRNSKARPAP